MKKTSLVFSLVREQSNFMTVVISVLTFLSVLALGIALSVGGSVIRWNNQWEKYATVQITNLDNTKTVKKIFEANSDKIESVNEISKSEMESRLKPWISSGAKLNDYLPQMFEIKLKKSSDMQFIKNELSTRAKFLTHTSAVKSSMNAGLKLVGITSFVLIMMLISIGVCVSYISRNIAMLHKHELEILNQVGATDKFIAHQMQIIVGKISTVAALVGFASAVPILLLILTAAHSARVGLMATLSLKAFDWLLLLILPILIIIFSVHITKKTTLKILSEN
jgi:cell division transport system permease protein